MGPALDKPARDALRHDLMTKPRDPFAPPPSIYDEATAAAIVRWYARRDERLLTDGPVLDLVPDGHDGWRRAQPDDASR